MRHEPKDIRVYTTSWSVLGDVYQRCSSNQQTIFILFAWLPSPLWLFFIPPVIDIQLQLWLTEHTPISQFSTPQINCTAGSTITHYQNLFLPWDLLWKYWTELGAVEFFVSCLHSQLGRPWQQGLWGRHGAHLGPTGSGLAPYWPHEFCYLGILFVFVSIFAGGCPYAGEAMN